MHCTASHGALSPQLIFICYIWMQTETKIGNNVQGETLLDAQWGTTNFLVFYYTDTARDVYLSYFGEYILLFQIRAFLFSSSGNIKIKWDELIANISHYIYCIRKWHKPILIFILLTFPYLACPNVSWYLLCCLASNTRK